MRKSWPALHAMFENRVALLEALAHGPSTGKYTERLAARVEDCTEQVLRAARLEVLTPDDKEALLLRLAAIG